MNRRTIHELMWCIFNLQNHGNNDIPDSLGTFPDQKTTIQRLLYDKDESLLPRGEDPKGSIMRYFHIPSNNMEACSLKVSSSGLLLSVANWIPNTDEFERSGPR